MPPSVAIPTLDLDAPSLLLPRGRSASFAANWGWSGSDAKARQVAAIELACRRSGGIATADEVIHRMRRSERDQPLSRLARWIVAREVVHFEWQATLWLPLFQFEPSDMSAQPEVGLVIRELADVFDDWDIACWFTLPNTWLGNMTPVDAIGTLPDAVKEAARVDRFVARG